MRTEILRADLRRVKEAHAKMKQDTVERERFLTKVQSVWNERKKTITELEVKVSEKFSHPFWTRRVLGLSSLGLLALMARMFSGRYVKSPMLSLGLHACLFEGGCAPYRARVAAGRMLGAEGSSYQT